MNKKNKIHIGLIGSGFMGQAHAIGYAIANKVFDLPTEIVLHTVADVSDSAAKLAANRYGFIKWSADWRTMIADPEIDVIDITTPNAFHKDMSLAAIAAGKHVYCEKPLALCKSDADEMVTAAEKAGVITQVGFNYLGNPMFSQAKKMIQAGILGDVLSYRGCHCEDYMSSSDSPHSFRTEILGGGVLADLGSHALATAEFLIGPISKVFGDCVTVISERPDPKVSLRPVDVDDISRILLRFDNGISGYIEVSWLATGRKMQHDFEVHGSKGSLIFSQERFNELHYYSVDDDTGQRGFRRIEAGPEHEPYGLFCVAPGHQLGFNDLKAIEIAGFVNAINHSKSGSFSFRDGARIQTLVDLIGKSSRSQRWLSVDNTVSR